MLFHNLDADPNDPLTFTWTEVYKDSASFVVHVQNLPFQEYVDRHAELGDEFSIKIYGNVSDEVFDNINELGSPIKHFKTTAVGYIREGYFK